MKNKLVDIIYQSLRAAMYSGDGNHYDEQVVVVKTSFNGIRIHDVSLDGDNDSSEVIITLDDGEQKKDFVISNNDIREIE